MARSVRSISKVALRKARSRPGTRSKLPAKYLTPSQRASRKRHQQAKTQTQAQAPAKPQKTHASAMSQLPQDGTYMGQLANIQKQYFDTIGSLDRQARDAQLDTGLTLAGGIDPTNPFSKAALLQRTYQQARQGNTTSYAAQGQLYSGALQNAQNQTQFREQTDMDSLKKAFARLLADIQEGKQQAAGSASQGAVQAQAEAIARALAGG